MHATHALVLTAIALLAGSTIAAEKPKVGEEFPDFTANNFPSRDEFSLSDLRGRVVIVDFWATWCGPCVGELPNVKKVYDKYKEEGLTIVSISLDSNKSKLEQFIEKEDMDWYHTFDGGGWKAELAQKYDIHSIPAMFVVGRDGVVVAANVHGAALEKAVQKALEAEWAGDAKEKEAKAALAAADKLRDNEQWIEAYETYQQIAKDYRHTYAGSAAKKRVKELQRDPKSRKAILAVAKEEKCGQWLKFARDMAAAEHTTMAKKYYQKVIDQCGGTEAGELATAEMAAMSQ